MLDSLLSLDRSLLLEAITIVPPEYAKLLHLAGESIVLWGGCMLIWLWLYGIKREDNRYKVIALSIFFTIILTFIFYTVINFGPKWRPGGMELTGATALIPHPIDNSFPSGHALFTGALLMALLRFLPWRSLLIGTVLFGTITAFARVTGGVHYPGDILGGWAFGALGGAIFSWILDASWFRSYIVAPLVAFARFFRL